MFLLDRFVIIVHSMRDGWMDIHFRYNPILDCLNLLLSPCARTVREVAGEDEAEYVGGGGGGKWGGEETEIILSPLILFSEKSGPS